MLGYIIQLTMSLSKNNANNTKNAKNTKKATKKATKPIPAGMSREACFERMRPFFEYGFEGLMKALGSPDQEEKAFLALKALYVYFIEGFLANITPEIKDRLKISIVNLIRRGSTPMYEYSILEMLSKEEFCVDADLIPRVHAIKWAEFIGGLLEELSNNGTVTITNDHTYALC